MISEPKTIELGGRSFTLAPIPLRRAGDLERKLLRIVAPVLIGGLGKILQGIDLKGLDKGSKSDADLGKDILGRFLSSNIDLDSFAQSIQDALSVLPDAEFNQLILGMLERVQYHGPEGSEYLNNWDRIDEAFDSTAGIYLMIFEVARFNKFLPFGLAGTGNSTLKTSGMPRPAGNA